MLKSSIIALNKENLIYEGVSYNYKDFLKEIKLLKNRIIIILNEGIYIKTIHLDSKNNNLQSYIDSYIEEDFGEEEDYLMDYKINKSKEKLYVYAIKGGRRITKLCKGAKELTVIPIQTIIMNKINKKYETKNYTCFFSYDGVCYYLKVRDKFMESSSNITNIEEVRKWIVNIELNEVIYITKDLECLLKEFNVIVIGYGERLNEEIFKK